MPVQLWRAASQFLPTPSVRRATSGLFQSFSSWIFLPTPSVRRATSSISASNVIGNQFLPTPSVRRATFDRPGCAHLAIISTHALREEGDGSGPRRSGPAQTISTHALREEGDLCRWLKISGC